LSQALAAQNAPLHIDVCTRIGTTQIYSAP